MESSSLLIERNVSLSRYSTFGIGGPASYFCRVKNEDELRAAFLFAKSEKITWMVLGKGSNCLFSDKGYNGLIILNKMDFISEKEPGHFDVGSGYSFSHFGSKTTKDGWKGLEFAAGIPGTVGGAVFMNAGAQGSDSSSTITSVLYMHENGKVECFDKKDLAFGYRTSSFQKMKGALVMASFLLKHDKEAESRQKELLEYRMKTQPYKERSIGCFFRNPPGNSAGRLIEEVGLKGYSVGGACVSEIHANFIVNRNSASSMDVVELMKLVQDKVYEVKGLLLQPEIRVIPYE